MTSTGLGIAALQVPRTDALGKLFVGAQPPDVRFIRVEGPRQNVLQTKRPQDEEEVLEADATLTLLESHDRVPVEPGARSELSLGQATQLPPCLQRRPDRPQGAFDLKRRGPLLPRRLAVCFFVIVLHIAVTIAVINGDIRLYALQAPASHRSRVRA